ncbi:hypothetical protein BJY04DRAFT_197024 [Aspergillus karnatakaensis]|uniref:uncharacterized protein n=1 Tax=Aspergillus karnatakaensis TaxID=1810916 RepID=UPI003CCDFA56
MVRFLLERAEVEAAKVPGAPVASLGNLPSNHKISNIELVVPRSLFKYALTFSDDTAILQLLLQRGAHVYHNNVGYNRSSLSIAAQRNNVNALLLLLEWGACLDEVDSTGKTPLGVAFEHNSIDAAKVLIQKGCDKFKACSLQYAGKETAIAAFYSDMWRGLGAGVA